MTQIHTQANRCSSCVLMFVKLLVCEGNVKVMCDYVADVWTRTSSQNHTRVGSKGGNGNCTQRHEVVPKIATFSQISNFY